MPIVRNTVRNIVILALALGCAAVVLSRRRRSAAEQRASASRSAPRRSTEREARVSRLARETWEDEGGAIPEADALRR